jgi:hypothetical protein
MGEEGDTLLSPQRPVPIFAEGDMVHVFEGTGVGKEGLRNVGWFGKVVGRERDAYLLLSGGREVYENTNRFWVGMW